MLVIDMEFTGIDPEKHAIISIGAVDFDNPERQFYEECQIFEGAELDPAGLAVNGFTEAECKDPNKKTQEEALKDFYHWINMSKDQKIMAGQNAFLDREMINKGFERVGIDFRFHYRILEIHSIAYYDYIKKGIEIPQKNDYSSALSLDKIAEYVGLPEEPKPHNALTGAKLEAEILSRLFYGKNLLDEFKDYKVPEMFK